MTVRFQFDLSDENAAELDRLRELGGCKDNGELFNSAITILRWAMEQTQQHRVIRSHDLETVRFYQLTMPCLRRLQETCGAPVTPWLKRSK